MQYFVIAVLLVIVQLEEHPAWRTSATAIPNSFLLVSGLTWSCSGKELVETKTTCVCFVCNPIQ